jgi:hypothetical protein
MASFEAQNHFQKKSSRKKNFTPLFSIDDLLKGPSSKFEAQAVLPLLKIRKIILPFPPLFSKSQIKVILQIHNKRKLQIIKKQFKVLVNFPKEILLQIFRISSKQPVKQFLK